MFLLLLLVLSSASLNEAMKNHSTEENVPPLTPDLKNGFADIISNVTVSTVRRFLPPTKSRNKRQVDSYASVFDQSSKLRWEGWNGYLPNGAVSIYNDYASRVDYVCKYGCHSGFYNPSKGSYCHYPYYNEEHTVSSFDILVNENGFEKLEWKAGSYGSVPENSVSCCPSTPLYVAKNKYGLGKVHPKHESFFLPWDGKEYWYKYYDVLTTNMDAVDERISHFTYSTFLAEKLKNPPKVFKKTTTSNNDCQPLSKKIGLSIKTSETSKWDFSFSQILGVKVSMTVGVPKLLNFQTEITSQTTFQYSKGSSVTEEVIHNVIFDLIVPPNHSCTLKIVGYEYNTKVPFSARLSRTYRTGETSSTTIYGTYLGVESAEINAEVDRCEFLPDAQPCP